MRLTLTLLFVCAATVRAQGPLRLREEFTPETVTHARLETDLSGRLALPRPGAAGPEVVPFRGTSLVEYDERPLTPASDGADRVVRAYSTVDIKRTLGDKPQSAEVRPAVRRMVVLRGTGSVAGKKVPFSPDGPLTLAEIDVVRVDLFAPALVAGLLPKNAVSPGDKWRATEAAVRELTDYESIEASDLEVTFAAVVALNGKKLAKLTLAGTVSGATEDGPSRQLIRGTGYFDLGENRLTYLKITGNNQLLGPKGVTAGEVTGTFTLTRSKVEPPKGLGAESLQGLELQPNATNSLLLYDDPTLGLKLLYSRGWRIGLTSGRQLALDESGGKSGLLITVMSPDQTPTLAGYRSQVKAFGTKAKWQFTAETPPGQDAVKPSVGRFGFDVTKPGGQALRMEYALIATKEAGATVAGSVAPGPDAAKVRGEALGVVRSMELSRPGD